MKYFRSSTFSYSPSGMASFNISRAYLMAQGGLGGSIQGAVVGTGVAGVRNAMKSKNWTDEEKIILATGTPEEKAALRKKMQQEGRRVSYKKAAAIGSGVGTGLGALGGSNLYSAVSNIENLGNQAFSRNAYRRADFMSDQDYRTLEGNALAAQTIASAGDGALKGLAVAGVRNALKARKWTDEEKIILATGTPEEKAALRQQMQADGRRVSYKKAAAIGAGIQGTLGTVGGVRTIHQMRQLRDNEFSFTPSGSACFASLREDVIMNTPLDLDPARISPAQSLEIDRANLKRSNLSLEERRIYQQRITEKARKYSNTKYNKSSRTPASIEFPSTPLTAPSIPSPAKTAATAPSGASRFLNRRNLAIGGGLAALGVGAYGLSQLRSNRDEPANYSMKYKRAIF